jgi:hypothetical protein
VTPSALPFGRLWCGEADAISNAINYAKFYSRSHDAVIRVYDKAGNVIETHEHTGDSKSGDALDRLKESLPSCSV